jgi:hypothetical protein
VSSVAFDDPQLPINPPIAPLARSKYSMVVAARPTVSVLDVYTEAPTSDAAKRLADASAAGLAKGLAGPGGFGLSATQLGNGAQVNAGASARVPAALARFLGVLALSLAATLIVGRARRTCRAGYSCPEQVSA